MAEVRNKSASWPAAFVRRHHAGPHAACSYPPTPTPALLQACRLHPVLKALCEDPKITPEYLERRVKKVDPDFRIGPVTTRPAFTPAQIIERLKFCNEYAFKDASFWHQVVFYDEFTVYEEPLPLTAIYRAGHMPTLTDRRKHNFKYGTYNKLSLCYAVNAHVGLVGWWWIHTTSGYDKLAPQKKCYFVSGRGGAHLSFAPLCPLSPAGRRPLSR